MGAIVGVSEDNASIKGFSLVVIDLLAHQLLVIKSYIDDCTVIPVGNFIIVTFFIIVDVTMSGTSVYVTVSVCTTISVYVVVSVEVDVSVLVTVSVTVRG